MCIKKQLLCLVIICLAIFSNSLYAQQVKPAPQDKQQAQNKTLPQVSAPITPAPSLAIPDTTPITPAPCSGEQDGEGVLPCKRGQIDEGNSIFSAFYQIAPEYGNAFVSLLDKWKSKEGRINYADKFQLLTITDHKENIVLMERVMQMSDISAPQVLIEAQVLERIIKSDLQLGWDTSFDKDRNSKTFFRGIEEKFWPGAYVQSLQSIIPTLPAGTVSPGTFLQGSTFTFYTTGKRGTTDIKLKTMVDRNEATILSSPRVTVSSGSKAVISSGQEVPFQQVTVAAGTLTTNIQYKSAEIKLEVTATVIGGNSIKMTVIPEVKTVTSYQVLQGAETPVFASRRSETTVTIKSGDTIHIGGLAREEDVLYERGIPLLSEIPLIGNLFKRKQRDKNKTEIIFIIKPSIVSKPEDTIRPSIMEKK